MKTLILKTICLLMLITSSFGQDIPLDSLYFGQPTPGDSGVVFAPGRISVAGRNEPCITFSPDGKTAVFYTGTYPTTQIWSTEYKNGKWKTPSITSFSAGRSTGEPIFSPDGSKLYMFATNAINAVGSYDIAYSVKTDTTWSIPTSLGSPPNSAGENYHPCVVANNSIYFATGNGPLARSLYENGAYQPSVLLPTPINNPYVPQTWGDPFVAPNESYMLIKSLMPGGYGQHDIYISYKRSNGGWTNPKNLGNKINTPYDETTGDITPDGKYMTYASNKDLRWVKTTFIERLKHTNFVPYVKKSISSKTDSLGLTFSYTFPDTTFIDDDGNNTLTYTATLSNGTALPSWLTFDPNTRTFSGTLQQLGTYSIKITAKDTLQAAISTTFTLKVINKVSIADDKKFEQLVYAYPNPFNPTTSINFTLQNESSVNLVVYNGKGEVVANLINNKLNSGVHTASFNAEKLNSGVYFYKLTVNEKSVIRKIALIK